VGVAGNFQPFDLRSVQPIQSFEPRAGGVKSGNHRELPARSAELYACVICDAEVDVGDIGDVPEVVEGPGEVVFDCVLKRDSPHRQPRTNWDQQVAEKAGGG